MLAGLGNVEARSGNLTVARDLFQRTLHIAQRLASNDPHDAQAAFDVAPSLLRFIDLARREWDAPALHEADTAARDHLTRMEALGQLAGCQQREAARDYVRDLFARLSK